MKVRGSYMRKSRDNDWRRLQHMLDAAKRAQKFAEGKSRRAFEEDLQLQFALARAVEIVCEAACNITYEFQATNTQIAWKRIMGMRQWFVHANYKIDLNVLWETVLEDIPPLISKLEDILSSDDPLE